MSGWQHRLKITGRRLGVELSRHRPLAQRRALLIERLGIRVALDVGANIGQYGQELRKFGFRGEIVSFEPLSSAFAELRNATLSDPGWRAHNLALGETSTQLTMNVASNLASSSLLPVIQGHRALAPQIEMTGVENVEVATLDDLDVGRDGPLLLKLDVQGYEDRVLLGAARTLRDVELIECELSVVAFYEDQLRLTAMLSLLAEKGFDLVDLEPGQRGADGSVAYVDGLLTRQP